ncbi:uracil-DNA glycosylase [Lachancea thermotolerans CBS 6340]|uniref:Uracil-DNA glycosylase n=1 Tax=Lachancea thermotolerans (strain ATCC 56472 / CBS 6340 / NRRL Y-8284) TaxID=559295 RepID=C5DLY0_LACTC|nr:KLTH0G04400p [Lachancea thermotolerans CBS 6340]CAR24791.1 KLTH0G04400p [Lachancea thermotolerans CBS 6340]
MSANGTKRLRTEGPPGEGTKKQKTLMEFFGGKKVSPAKKKTDATTAKVLDTGTVAAAIPKRDGASLHQIGQQDKSEFRKSLTERQLKLLGLELDTLDDEWFAKLVSEFTKPYFLKLKDFVIEQQQTATVFPPPQDVYSWSRLTPFDQVRVVVIGQDPYHNFNQAHGLAFSVKPPTPAPPSLKNIYKELKEHNYADFQIDNKVGDLTHWATQGVLLLNTCLTVRAHNANSHSKRGWEQFTKRVVQLIIEDRKRSGKPIVFLLWGSNAGNLVKGLLGSPPVNFLMLSSVHPSPLSASRGFFGNKHFKKINEWLYDRNEPMIDWSVVPGSKIKEIENKNLVLDI